MTFSVVASPHFSFILKKMTPQRTIIIGDIHGCFDELSLLLQKCHFSHQNDQVICVGDLINKGPKSFEVLQLVRDQGFKTVLGNHELKLLEIAKSYPSRDSLSEKNQLFFQLLDQMGKQADDWIQWIQSWPKYIDDSNFLVVHGGFPPDASIQNVSVEVLSTIRTWDGEGKDLAHPENPAWHDLYHEEKLVVYGHWATQGLKIKDNSIGLDSGCVYGGQLSALILPERKIVQVDALKAYQSV